MSAYEMTTFATKFHVLQLDGYSSVGHCKSVEGGAFKADLITQQIGGTAVRVKQLGNRSIDPFTVQVGMAMTPPFWTWIQKSWDGECERRNGSLTTYDASMKPMHEFQFTEALVTETTIPTLDASQGGPLFLSVKFQPETLTQKLKPSGVGRAVSTPKAKHWNQSNFRFHLEGVDCGNVTKVESFTVKQNVKPVSTGPEGLYQYEATSLEFGNITFYTSLGSAKALLDWHKSFVVDGKSAASEEKTGSSTILSPSLGGEMLTINLLGVGMVSLTVDKADTMGSSTKKVKVELYVEQMSLDFNNDFVVV